MKADKIKKVAVVGSGVIGASWATNFAMKGLTVNIYDIDETKLVSAVKYVEGNLSYLMGKGLFTAEECDAALARVHCSTNPAVSFSNVQFIQESGPESYEIKKSMLKEIEAHTASDTIISSSTSGLKMSVIAEDAVHPERCIVGHPYNPPHLIPLVDVCRGEKTSDEVAQCTYDFYRLIGKEPVMLKKEALGFIANRLQMAVWREATEMVHRDICSIEDIDKALVFGPGLRWALMGIGLCLQLSGGEGGIEACLHHLEPSWNLWLEDMADWHHFPYETWPADVQNGVNEEKANRDSAFGNTDAEITRFRDDGLLELLRIHRKI